jgi:hypothetical protein
MPPADEQIRCPREPSHGFCTKRWLAPEDRQMITNWDGDVFEIDCAICGKYETRLDLLGIDVTREFSEEEERDFW